MKVILNTIVAVLGMTCTDARVSTRTFEQQYMLRDNTNRRPVGKPEGGWKVTPIHSLLLPDGKVMIAAWVREDDHMCDKFVEYGATYIIDPENLITNQVRAPITLNLSPLDEQPIRDEPGGQDTITFSGHSAMPGGKKFFFGGAFLSETGWADGIAYARVFDSTTQTFERVQFPSPIGRAWYPSAVTLPDARILVIAAFETARMEDQTAAMAFFYPERFEAKLTNPWDIVYFKAESRQELAPGLADYSRFFVLPQPITLDGRVRDLAVVGLSGRVVFMNTESFFPVSESRFADRPNNLRPGGCSGSDTAALLATGEIMLMGGCRGSNMDLYNPTADTWRTVDLGISRIHPSVVLLPNGMILIINGENGELQGQDTRQPQVYDPFLGTLETYQAEPVDNFLNEPRERGYHSVATLLQDGSVLIGGGRHRTGDIGCEQPSLRIFNPTYMTSGARRPTIVPRSQAPYTLLLDEPTSSLEFILTVFDGKSLFPSSSAPGTRSGAALIANSAHTHSFDQNQRYVPLRYEVTGRILRVFAPSRPQAVPGDYLLFVGDQVGIMSTGVHVRILPSTGEWERTVIYVKKKVPPGGRLYLAGGHSDSMRINYGGRAFEQIVHRNLLDDGPARRTMTRLGWDTPSSLSWTCMVGSPASDDFLSRKGSGQDYENIVEDDLWKFDVYMRRQPASNPAYEGWFEFRLGQLNPDGSVFYEAPVAHVTTAGPNPPASALTSTNRHWARRGYANLFVYQAGEAQHYELKEAPVPASQLPFQPPSFNSGNTGTNIDPFPGDPGATNEASAETSSESIVIAAVGILAVCSVAASVLVYKRSQVKGSTTQGSVMAANPTYHP